MDKTIAGLLGAVGALAMAAPSQAATVQPQTIHEAMQAAGYADLLKPIPNAASLLLASDALLAESGADVILVQDRDHHHHHRTYRRRPPRRTHHHHHSMMLLRDAPKPA